jgi:hypothetical protein
MGCSVRFVDTALLAMAMSVGAAALGGCDDGAAPQSSAGCKTDRDCPDAHSCTAGSCVAQPRTAAASVTAASAAAPKGPSDCRDQCEKGGRCVVEDGRCVPTEQKHCEHAHNCKTYGFCALVDDVCQVPAQTSADCSKEHGTKKHNPCVDWGRCTAQNGTCVVASDADCLRYRECKRHGYCKARDGRCVAP